MQEYYKILGVNESDSDEVVLEAYNKLKDKYSRERFYEGEIGNDAARNLTKVENAYREITTFRKENANKESNDSMLNKVELLIKEGNYTAAQNLLDEFDVRDAEWHYLQSVVFYKKNWYNESKKQLEIACNMDSSNTKYATALNKLKSNMEQNQSNFNRNNQNSANPQSDRQMGETNECCTFCATWCCVDMLCSICCR